MEYLGFVNLTPFSAEKLLLADEGGADVLTFVVKATYELGDGGGETGLQIAEEQVPVQMAGEYYGDPEATSLKYESDVAVKKPATDVVLVGHAQSGKGDVPCLDVSLRAGGLSKTVRVFGDRFWRRQMGFWSPSRPEPFAKMPLVYERSFGGWDRTHADAGKHEYEPRNPVGVGFVAKHGKVEKGAKLPNIEDPASLMRRPTDRKRPAGFGFVGPHWQPRVRFGGTYDEQWKKDRMPLLPKDFDTRFFSAATEGLVAPGFFQGGEPLEIVNASPRGTLRFTLPTVRPEAVVKMKDGTRRAVDMNLDTVVVNTDDDLLFLVWRGSTWANVYQVVWGKTQLRRAVA